MGKDEKDKTGNGKKKEDIKIISERVNSQFKEVKKEEKKKNEDDEDFFDEFDEFEDDGEFISGRRVRGGLRHTGKTQGGNLETEVADAPSSGEEDKGLDYHSAKKQYSDAKYDMKRDDIKPAGFDSRESLAVNDLRKVEGNRLDTANTWGIREEDRKYETPEIKKVEEEKKRQVY
ncbi:hypothetical protein HYW76_03970 [Candidatus Pacearchaeota archaeon]|nr:hypothetical protein [Candidatus Pacearchaeota archaeon]